MRGRAWRALSSLRLTIALLALLCVVVAACTLAQRSLGTYGAVKAYIRSPFIWWAPAGSPRRIPVFPGGGLIGVLLLVNLLAAQASRLSLAGRKAGLWIVHLGLILLFAGEFATGYFQKESQMVLKEGQTSAFVQSLHETELALIDVTDPRAPRTYSLPEERLSRDGLVADPGFPFAARVAGFERGATPDGAETAAAEVALEDGGRGVGAWRLRSDDPAPRDFAARGRRYQVGLRPRRIELPFSLTLRKFVHEVYPGTDIPKGFSSVVRLRDPGRAEDRTAVISMNNPLRYAGLSFYQASFEDNDTVSILQVVGNPGRLIPYLACALMTAGLLLHFLGRPGAGGRP